MRPISGGASYAIVAGGVAALLVAGWGLTGGGGLALGRLDPGFSLPGRFLFAAALAFVIRHRSGGAKLVGGVAMLGMSLLIDTLLGTLLAGRFAWEQAIVAVTMQAAGWAAAHAVLAHSAVRFPRTGQAALVVGTIIVAIAAVYLLPALYAPRAAGDRPRVAIVSGIPLEWLGPVDMATILNDSAQRSALLPALVDRFVVVQLDAVDPQRLTDVDVLVLAHPRPLAPAELVDIDRWVREGGRVLILADPLLSWPPDYPLGNPRNPPIISLLTPLLDHWGVDLGSPASEGSDIFMAGDDRVHAISMGRFRVTRPDCSLVLGGRSAVCTIGRGRAVLVADADLLNPALWSGGSRGAAGWREGNVAWIIGLIRELAGSGRAEPFVASWRLPAAGRGESESPGSKTREQEGNFDVHR